MGSAQEDVVSWTFGNDNVADDQIVRSKLRTGLNATNNTRLDPSRCGTSGQAIV